MTNQTKSGTPTSRRFALCPTTIVAGEPVLLGTVPAVAIDSYQSNYGGTTFMLNGSFALTVVGQTVESPQTTHKINPGDKIYATGTLDSTTNVTYGLTLDANSSNTLFGRLDPDYVSVAAGATDTAAEVMIGVGE